MLAAVLLGSILINIYAIALRDTGPEIIALVRTASIALLLYIFLKPKKRVRKNRKQAISFSAFGGLSYGVGAIVGLYALRDLGIVTTMLLMLFGPALRYLSAYFILKDKPTRKEVISSGLLGLIAAGVAFV
jgi:drug/metabolite transporter (DMT)-like permease